jgi:hypothetical protein
MNCKHSHILNPPNKGLIEDSESIIPHTSFEEIIRSESITGENQNICTPEA